MWCICVLWVYSCLRACNNYAWHAGIHPFDQSKIKSGNYRPSILFSPYSNIIPISPSNTDNKNAPLIEIHIQVQAPCPSPPAPSSHDPAAAAPTKIRIDTKYSKFLTHDECIQQLQQQQQQKLQEQEEVPYLYTVCKYFVLHCVLHVYHILYLHDIVHVWHTHTRICDMCNANRKRSVLKTRREGERRSNMKKRRKKKFDWRSRPKSSKHNKKRNSPPPKHPVPYDVDPSDTHPNANTNTHHLSVHHPLWILMICEYNSLCLNVYMS
jgi:hypothetical protein